MEFQFRPRCAVKPLLFLPCVSIAALSFLRGCGVSEFAPGTAAAPGKEHADSGVPSAGVDARDAGKKAADAGASRVVVPPATGAPVRDGVVVLQTERPPRVPVNPTLPADTPASTPTAPKTVSGDLCAGRSETLPILILDLKSGWFAGDGGLTFKAFTSTACAAKVEIVYAHVTQSVVEGTIFAAADKAALLSCLATPADEFDGITGRLLRPDLHTSCVLGDLRRFQQIWLLTGSEKDAQDVTIASPFFASLRSRLADFVAAEGGRGIFIGAGLGNTEHANALASALFPSKAPAVALFRPTQWGEVGTVPQPALFRNSYKQSPLLAQDAGVSPLAPGHFEASHALLGGLATLADFDRADQSNLCSGDEIVLPGLARGSGLLAVDACGQASVAAFGDAGGRRFVFDGNMARFYATKPEAWFNRIVNWLGRAGEK